MRQRTTRRRQQRSETGSEDRARLQFPSLRLCAGFLLLATVVLFSSVRNHDFINYDDDDYIVRNQHVTTGLSWENFRWSLTSTELANWHPITWMSHQLDCELFGLDAGYHHLTSLLLHALNALLLFFLLQRATGALKRSFLVAALFAWHPFAVESVAWVAERKNLLSTLFFLLALGAYGRYAKRPSFKTYALVPGMFALSLASKPMAVTLPPLLLLLDYWPLCRIEGWTAPSSSFPLPQKTFWWLVREKLPLFALSIISCGVTIWAQTKGEAVRSTQLFPLGVRLANALYSYVAYLLKAVWPLHLALLYPHPGRSLPLWKPVCAGLVLCAITVAGWMQRQQRPYLLIGWLWFVGTLVPVIGVIQVGDQAMADRYTYVPLIGIFVLAVWGITELFDSRQVPATPRWVIAALVLTALCVLTARQLSYWQNAETVWAHSLEATGGSLLIEKQLANAMVRQNDKEAAVPHLLNVAKLDPSDVPTRVNLGAYYLSQGQAQDAIHELEAAVQLTNAARPGDSNRQYRTTALINLGVTYISLKDYPNSLARFRQAAREDPATVDHLIATYGNSLNENSSELAVARLALLLSAKGNVADASSLLQQAINENPDYADSRALLAYLDSGQK